jgi:hypothetical protein
MTARSVQTRCPKKIQRADEEFFVAIAATKALIRERGLLWVSAVMDALPDIAARLSAISDEDLCRLRAFCDATPQVTPGLLAWLYAAAGWEQDRRAGRVYPLHGPTAIPDAELAKSVTAAAMLAKAFRENKRRDGTTIATLFDVLGVILRAEGERAGTLQ